MSGRCVVTGEITCCRTGKTKLQEVAFELGNGSYGNILYIRKGGVTGYESFYVKDYHDPEHKRGWTACAGTKGRWDKLFIPPEEMKKVFEYFEIGVRYL